MNVSRPSYKRRYISTRAPCVFCLLLCSLLHLILFSDTAIAATYYVDAVNGDDSYAGTSSQAWKTLSKAQSIAIEGDIVLLRSGNYGAFIDATTRRTDWVTYKADDGHTPVFTYIKLGQWNGPFNKYLKFDGIAVEGGPIPGDAQNFAVSAISANYLQFLNMHIYGTVDYNQDSSCGIWLRDNDEVIVQDCNIHHFASQIRVSGSATYTSSDVTVDRCMLHDGFWAMIVFGDRWTISNNTIYDCNDGMNVTCRDTLIEENHILNLRPGSPSFHGDGIQLYPHPYYSRECSNVTVRGNIIHTGSHFGMSVRDEGGETCDNIIIENNLTYDQTVGDVQLETVLGVIFRGNTAGGRVSLDGTCTGAHIYGNIAYELLLADEAGVDYENYNICWNRICWGNTIPVGDNTINYNKNDALFQANFVNYAAKNFQLAQHADAVDDVPLARATIADLNGQARINIVGQGSEIDYADAGCYEYVPVDSNSQTYSITAGADSVGGVISPSGTTQVNEGDSQEYSITPEAGYNIADVLVDGGSIGAVSNYTFDDVAANHTITASFAVTVNTYSIVSTAGVGGAISPSGTTQVNEGDSQEYSITPEAGYNIADVLVDGGSIGAVSNYTFDDVAANHTIAAVFEGLDEAAPIVTNCSPEANSIQIPLNHLIILHIVDAAKGVDANSVTITINENTVYTGNTADCNSEYGHCRRTGDKADYKFIYQSKTSFDFDQTMTIAVNAADLEGNVMSEYSYSFKTEMRAFGKNKQVSSASNDLSKGRPATVRDSSGNVWVAWHAGPTGSRDIYIGKLTAEAENFSSSIRLTTDALDQCNAAIAIDNSDKLYVAWQDNRRENWDIYTSTSIDGINWSAETRVTDSNDNEINPVIAVDGALPNKAYIVWQDDRESNQDIYTAVSSNGFVTKTISQITSDVTDQVEPAVAVDSDNTVYVVWTDVRGGSSDIYGAASNNLWTNVPIVNKANNQSSPAIAVESAGSILHLLWVDDTPGNKDIYYASSNGLPVAPLTGNSVIDDDSGADQLSPAVITTGTTGDDLKVFACWQDERNVVNSNADTDLYFVEASTGGKTNVLVGDDSTGSEQSVPAMRIDGDGQPYLVWADTRNTNADIYYAGSTFSEPNPLASEDISALSNTTTTVGTELESITSVDGVSIIVPAGAYFCDIKITISRVKNPPKIAMERFSLPYEFGPSGAEFAEPVTITIPYEATASSESTSAYWYNPLTATLSQEGITNVEDIVISPTLHALRFQTTHFTQFFIGGSGSGSSGGIFGIGGGSGGGGAGGCSVSQNCRGSLVEFLMPYIGLMAVMLIIKRRDTQNRKTRNT